MSRWYEDGQFFFSNVKKPKNESPAIPSGVHCHLCQSNLDYTSTSATIDIVALPPDGQVKLCSPCFTTSVCRFCLCIEKEKSAIKTCAVCGLSCGINCGCTVFTVHNPKHCLCRYCASTLNLKCTQCFARVAFPKTTNLQQSVPLPSVQNLATALCADCLVKPLVK